MAWILLLLAGLFEIGWAVGLKYTDGFREPLWSAVSVVLLAAFVLLLTRALAVLPLGTAYAVWTGIGTVGTALLGILILGESAAALRLVCIGLILMGIVGLKLVSAE